MSVERLSSAEADVGPPVLTNASRVRKSVPGKLACFLLYILSLPAFIYAWLGTMMLSDGTARGWLSFGVTAVPAAMAWTGWLFWYIGRWRVALLLTVSGFAFLTYCFHGELDAMKTWED